MSAVQILNQIIFVVSLAYVGTIFYLMSYLKRAHHSLWESFGGKGIFDTDGPIDSYRFVRTGFFALFQGRHRALADGKVTGLVFAIRLMLLAALVLISVRLQIKAGGS